MLYQQCLQGYTASNGNISQTSITLPQFPANRVLQQVQPNGYLSVPSLLAQETASSQFIAPLPFYVNPPVPVFPGEKPFVCINNLSTCTNVKCGKHGECTKCYMRHYMRQYKRDEKVAKESGIHFLMLYFVFI